MTLSVPSATEIAAPVTRWSDGELRERSRLTRRRLLLAAGDLFDSRGYHGAALSDILKAAGLTKGALYFHFRSKKALAETLLVEVQDSWALLVAEIAERGLDPLWRLLVETDAYVARWMYDPLVRGVSRAIDDPDLHSLRQGWLSTWEDSTVECLREADAAGLLADHVDARRAGRAVVAVAAGNYGIADDPADLWTRMTETWEGLLPIMARPGWCTAWADSAWRDRALPDPEAYRLARRP